jgi:GxxExxY protein
MTADRSTGISRAEFNRSVFSNHRMMSAPMAMIRAKPGWAGSRKTEGQPMGTDEGGLRHKDLTQKVIGVFYDVYNELGSGFLESVYANAMATALREAGLQVEQESPIPVHFRGTTVGDFRADRLVEGAIICELKAAAALEPVFEAQLLNYLRATDVEVGLLFNFGPKAEFKRLVFSNSRKKSASIGENRRQNSV